jgi:ketosteroid isomerase-like protein
MSQELTEELVRTFLELWYEAYARQDVDCIVENGYGFEDGFGFRTLAPRHPLPEEDRRAVTGAFFKGMDTYEVGMEDFQIKIIDDIALAWGHQHESFQRSGLEPESYRVRSSFTMHMTEDGTIEMLMAHRDIQGFEGGYYVPRSTKPKE